MRRERKFARSSIGPNLHLIVPLGIEAPIAQPSGEFRTEEEMRSGFFLGNWREFTEQPKVREIRVVDLERWLYNIDCFFTVPSFWSPWCGHFYCTGL